MTTSINKLLRPEKTNAHRVDSGIQPTLSDSQVLEFCKTGILELTAVIPDSTNIWVTECIEREVDRDPAAITQNNLLAEERFVREVLLHPEVAGVTRSLLGEQFQLPDWLANHRLDGPAAARPWHVDAGSKFERTLNMLQIFYYPQDAAPDMGPTLFMPGSHLAPIAREELEHFGNLAGQVMTESLAGSVFFTAYSIWHRQPLKKAEGVRNLLKWDSWRTASPRRDWIVDKDFDFGRADYAFENDYFCSAARIHQSVPRIAELFLWLCGRSAELHHHGGASWPYSVSDPDFRWDGAPAADVD